MISKINRIDIGEIIQIHGTFSKHMIMGYYDESLLSNKIILNNIEITDTVIKKKHIETADEILLDDIFKLVDSAGIYIVVGMSIGESDSLWWNSIIKAMIKNKSMLLYIGHCDEEFINLKSSRLELYRNDIINRFISNIELTPEEKEYVTKNIIVDTSNENFNFPKF